jgi:hypothetical protein
MNAQHLRSADPVGWIRSDAQGRVLWLLGAAVVVASLVLARIGDSLITEAAPLGIIDFEFAGSAERSAQILASWSSAAREAAMLSLGFDYLYLVLYPSFIALACARTSARLAALRPGLGRWGVGLACLVLLSGVFDAIENYGLIRQLLDGANTFWARVALWCAVPKFALVGAGLLYGAIGTSAAHWIARPQAESESRDE